MTKQRRSYVARIIARRCTKCGKPLAPGELTRCEPCVVIERRKRTTPAARKRDAAQSRRAYAANPDPKRAAVRELRIAKKLRGECRDCCAPIEPDSLYCIEHNRKRREYRKRKWATRLTHGRSAAINSVMQHTHPAPSGSPFVRGCPECERQWIAAGLGSVERMKPLGFKEPAREPPGPEGNASEAGWDRADFEADARADAEFIPADSEPVRHDP